MRIFRSLLLIAISIAVLAGLVHAAHQRNLIPEDSLLGNTPYQAAEWISKQVDTIIEQLSPTATQVQEVSDQSGAILGEFIQVNDKNEDKKLHERTLELAQYAYCKQIVEEWEKNLSESESTNATENKTEDQTKE